MIHADIVNRLFIIAQVMYPSIYTNQVLCHDFLKGVFLNTNTRMEYR